MSNRREFLKKVMMSGAVAVVAPVAASVAEDSVYDGMFWKDVTSEWDPTGAFYEGVYSSEDREYYCFSFKYLPKGWRIAILNHDQDSGAGKYLLLVEKDKGKAVTLRFDTAYKAMRYCERHKRRMLNAS